MSRGRRHPVARPLSALPCPQADCRQPLALTDGRQVYVALPGQPAASARVTQRVTLCCARPGCSGCVTWHPPRGPQPPEA